MEEQQNKLFFGIESRLSREERVVYVSMCDKEAEFWRYNFGTLPVSGAIWAGFNEFALSYFRLLRLNRNPDVPLDISNGTPGYIAHNAMQKSAQAYAAIYPKRSGGIGTGTSGKNKKSILPQMRQIDHFEYEGRSYSEIEWGEFFRQLNSDEKVRASSRVKIIYKEQL